MRSTPFLMTCTHLYHAEKGHTRLICNVLVGYFMEGL